MFEISLKLIRYFEFIENNILKWESGQHNKIPINVDIKTKYDFYKKEIEKYKKELDKNFNDIYLGTNKTKEINDIIKTLSDEITSNFNSFLNYIKKEFEKIEEIVLPINKKNLPILLNFEGKLESYQKVKVASSIGIVLLSFFSSIGATGELALALSFSSIIVGGGAFLIFGIILSLSLLICFGLFRLISKILNKKRFRVYYNDIVDKLDAIKHRVIEKMDSLYNSTISKIDETLLSVEEKIKNIIENKLNRKIFSELKENYIKFLLHFNNINNN